MLRAVQSTLVDDAKLVQEYNELKVFWGVTRYLETLLGHTLLPSFTKRDDHHSCIIRQLGIRIHME